MPGLWTLQRLSLHQRTQAQTAPAPTAALVATRLALRAAVGTERFFATTLRAAPVARFEVVLALRTALEVEAFTTLLADLRTPVDFRAALVLRVDVIFRAVLFALRVVLDFAFLTVFLAAAFLTGFFVVVFFTTAFFATVFFFVPVVFPEDFFIRRLGLLYPFITLNSTRKTECLINIINFRFFPCGNLFVCPNTHGV